jgi:RND family efflux transporter MFP subunit
LIPPEFIMNRYIRRLALAFVAVGAVAGSGCAKETSPPAPQPASAEPAPSKAEPVAGGAIEVRLSADARTRAGIELRAPVHFTSATALRLPGTVAPDAYGQTKVVALVAGRVTTVQAELGTRVNTGDILARITSPDFADAQASYLEHRIALEADHQRIVRLERMVEIGAASRQELDDARAMHATHSSDVERAKSRLLLLGFSSSDVDELAATNNVRSDYAVRAPSAGVVTQRDVNPGQVVAAEAPLMQVSRVDRVWILASAYAQDASRLTVGATARVIVTAGGAPALEAAITYIDPQVDPATRTVQVRLETTNPGSALRFGTLVDIEVQVPAPRGALAVPAEAVQLLGDVAVVYVQDSQRPEVLVEHRVTTGATANGLTIITSGLSEEDRVVSSGSFAVRAERIRALPLTAAAPGRGR